MSQQVLGTRGLNALEASAAIALITLATEPDVTIMAFSDDFIPVNLKPGMRLEEVMAAMAMPFGFTDCSLPMIWAEEQRRKFDGIVVYTDSETHARWITPAQALQNYRRAFSPNAKCVVVGMTATEISIADPNDRGMLDVVGCDAATPALIADFLREDARTPDLAGRPDRLGNRTPS
jgi:60 kDa SS-A/Ro ribonucleoprotein